MILLASILPEHSPYIENLRKVMMLIWNYVLTPNLKRCKFSADKIEYLGHIIPTGKLNVAENTTYAIRDMKYHSKITELM